MIRKSVGRFLYWLLCDELMDYENRLYRYEVLYDSFHEQLESLARQVKTVPQLHDINVKRIVELKQKIEYMQQDIRDLQHDAEALDRRIDG